MEGPQPVGAGPESTGNLNKQLRLFDQEYKPGLEASKPIDLAALTISGMRRLHSLGHRPDRLHTDTHFSVRGDRLEFDCTRRVRPERNEQ